jgi:hypothetical protein
MKRRNGKNLAIGILCCMLVYMGIGYAALSQVLKVTTTGNVTGQWKIYIDSADLNTETNTNKIIESKSIVNPFKLDRNDSSIKEIDENLAVTSLETAQELLDTKLISFLSVELYRDLDFEKVESIFKGKISSICGFTLLK